MKGLKYHFKYLLYPGGAKRFTREEAVLLANRSSEEDFLLSDLATRSKAYRTKVLSCLKKYPDLLDDQIQQIASLVDPK